MGIGIDISVLVPTRNRPWSVQRLVDSGRQTAHDSRRIEFVFYLDSDDPTRNQVESMATAYAPLAVKTIVGDRCVLSEMWNRCYAESDPQATIFMHCGDDIVFRTNGWDEMVCQAFAKSADKIILVHGRDGIQDATLATHGFYHKNWIDAIGYFMPPYFASDYNDLWWTEVADDIGRRVYLPTLYTEHMHPLAGKSSWDRTHRERLARHQNENCGKIYQDLAHLRQEDVKKLRRVMQL